MKQAEKIELQIMFRGSVYSIGHICQDKDNQAIFAFNIGEWHLTVHREKDGRLLRTFYDPKKRKRSIDYQYIGTARALGYRDPERHGNYIAHSPLISVAGRIGPHLITIGTDLSDDLLLKNETARKKVRLLSNEPHIRLAFYLVEDNAMQISEEYAVIVTKLGKIVVRIEHEYAETIEKDQPLVRVQGA